MIGLRKSINYAEHLCKVFAFYGTIFFVLLVIIGLSWRQDTGERHFIVHDNSLATITKYYTDQYEVFVFAGNYKPTTPSNSNTISQQIYTQHNNQFVLYSNNMKLNTTSQFAHPVISSLVSDYSKYIEPDKRLIVLDNSQTSAVSIQDLLNPYSQNFQTLVNSMKQIKDSQHVFKGLFLYFDDDFLLSQPVYNLISNIQNAISSVLYFTQLQASDLPIYFLTSPNFNDTMLTISSTLFKSDAFIYNNISDFTQAQQFVSSQSIITSFPNPYFSAQFDKNLIQAGNNYDCAFEQENNPGETISNHSPLPNVETNITYGAFTAYSVNQTSSLHIQCAAGSYNGPSGTGNFDLLDGQYTIDFMIEQQNLTADNTTGGVLFTAQNAYHSFAVAINPVGLSGLRIFFDSPSVPGNIDLPWNTNLFYPNLQPEGFTQLTFQQDQNNINVYINGIQAFTTPFPGPYDIEHITFFHSNDQQFNNWDKISVKSLLVFLQILTPDEIKALRYANLFLNSPSIQVQNRPD